MYAQINGTELFYLEQGQGIGLLTLHGGLGFDHTYLRPYLDPLSERTRLVYFDQRGHGRSGRPPLETVTHAQLVEDAEALRGQLGLGRMILFGQSYGGFLALEYALRYQQHLAGLVLCCTAPALDYPEVVMANASSRGTPEMVETLGRLLGSPVGNSAELRSGMATIFPLYFHRYDAAVGEAFDRETIFSEGPFNRAFAELIPAYNVAARLGEIRVPTLVLSGRHDWITPPEQGERIHRGIPGSELRIFESSGHFPFIEEADAFLETLGDWLGRVS